MAVIPLFLLGLFQVSPCKTQRYLSFRLYEGFREKMYSSYITTTLYFKKNQTFDDRISPAEKREELKILQKIYQLRHIEPVISMGITLRSYTRTKGFQVGIMCEENLYMTIQSIQGEDELYRVLIMGMEFPNVPVYQFSVRVSRASHGCFPFRFNNKKWYIGVLRPFNGDPAGEDVDENFDNRLPICARASMPEYSNRKTTYINQDVTIEARVTPRGKIRSIRIKEGHPSLNQMALGSTRGWKFHPSDVRKSTKIIILYKFSLFYR